MLAANAADSDRAGHAREFSRIDAAPPHAGFEVAALGERADEAEVSEIVALENLFAEPLIEAVVVRQDSAEVMVLNEVGARVLQLLEKQMSPAKVAALLPQEFEVSPEEADRDVRRYVSELLEAGIIEPAS